MLDITTLIMFAIGILVMWLLCKILAWPLKMMWKLLVNAIVGAVILLLFNMVGGLFGFTITITALRALLVGILGVPGVVILIILEFLL